MPKPPSFVVDVFTVAYCGSWISFADGVILKLFKRKWSTSDVRVEHRVVPATMQHRSATSVDFNLPSTIRFYSSPNKRGAVLQGSGSR
jgi:hypothetical protein